MNKPLPLLCAVIIAARVAPAQQDPTSRSWNQPVEPFRIAGNLYYVGASDVTSFLITTPAGHIILLSKNPVESIGNTRSIEAVIQNGAIVNR